MQFVLSSALSAVHEYDSAILFCIFLLFAKPFYIYLWGSLCFRKFLYMILFYWVLQKAQPETNSPLPLLY